MSAPSLDQNGQSASLRMPTVSPETAFFCLDRVCPPDAVHAPRRRVQAAGDIEDVALPVDRLIELARKRGVYLRPAQLDWRSLLIEAATNTMLLLLENGNVIVALGTGREGVEEIIVSDPLYQKGEPFFLPRVALEHAWRGDALIVKTKRTGASRALTWYISILSLCGLTAGLLLLLRVALDVTITGSAAQSDPVSLSAGGLHAGNPAATLRPTAAGTEPYAVRASAASEAPVSLEAEPAAPNEPLKQPPDAAPARTAEGGAGFRQLATGLEATVAQSIFVKTVAAVVVRRGAFVFERVAGSARLFHARVVKAAKAQAASWLGTSYDSAFPAEEQLRDMRPNAPTALGWYKHARALAVAEAQMLLQRLHDASP